MPRPFKKRHEPRETQRPEMVLFMSNRDVNHPIYETIAQEYVALFKRRGYATRIIARQRHHKKHWQFAGRCPLAKVIVSLGFQAPTKGKSTWGVYDYVDAPTVIWVPLATKEIEGTFETPRDPSVIKLWHNYDGWLKDRADGTPHYVPMGIRVDQRPPSVWDNPAVMLHMQDNFHGNPIKGPKMVANLSNYVIRPVQPPDWARPKSFRPGRTTEPCLELTVLDTRSHGQRGMPLPMYVRGHTCIDLYPELIRQYLRRVDIYFPVLNNLDIPLYHLEAACCWCVPVVQVGTSSRAYFPDSPLVWHEDDTDKKFIERMAALCRNKEALIEARQQARKRADQLYEEWDRKITEIVQLGDEQRAANRVKHAEWKENKRLDDLEFDADWEAEQEYWEGSSDVPPPRFRL